MLKKCAAALFLFVSTSVVVSADWLQWGGPNRNFTSPVTGLANAWPAEGPKAVWSRNLGEGYSSIVVQGNRAYTMYRIRSLLQLLKYDQEVVVALDTSTGKTVWEHRYDSTPLSGMDLSNGYGPHSTPLIVGDRIFTAGSMGHFFALDKATGKVLWSHNLHTEFGMNWFRGYSCSPTAYQNTVILTIGTAGQSVVAFDMATGRVVWKKHDFGAGPGSPLLINVDGQDQMVLFMEDGPVGINPGNGDLLWKFTHKTDWGLNISTPVWGPGNLLFLSSAYGTGSRVLRLARDAQGTKVEQVWASNRLRIHFGNAIRIGDYLYGSSGDFGPAFLTAVDINTGRIAWQDRTFARAWLLHADGKFIVLDEEGQLGLATVSPQGLKVLARAEVLTSNAWTPPTLDGSRLYMRDRKTIRAVELR